MKRRPRLSVQTAAILGLGIVVLQLLSVLTIVQVVLLPVARRSAEDLSGLIIISVQTYRQLGPDARPAFVRHLQRDDGIEIGPPPRRVPGFADVKGHLYRRLLEKALSRRLGRKVQVYSFARPSALWVSVPVAGHPVWVHFPRRRLASSLPMGVLLIIAISTVALLVLTTILVRRVLRPLGVLSEALRTSWKSPLPDLPPRGAQEFHELLSVFAHMRLRLQAMIDHQSLLLVGIAHDLRSPLARIQMALELLAGEIPHDLLEGMLQDTRRMSELLSQSLALGRGLIARENDLDLVELLEEAGTDFQRSGGSWNAVLPRRLPFRGDREALRRLFGNVMDNVQRHGGGKVEVRLRKEGRRKYLQFCDFGPGIPAGDLVKVFEPFFRCDDARGHGEGSGLGLAIARQIAEAQGIQLSLYNRPRGHGLCVELSWEN